MLNFWLTLNCITGNLRVHSDRKFATSYALRENRRSREHPLFFLWKSDSTGKTKVVGELHREFGYDFPKDPWKDLGRRPGALR